jgi:CxxC motif-containing protein (DUF1111 family)
MQGCNEIERTRKRVGWFMAGCFILLGGWTLSPGLPVIWAPRADASVKLAGLELFNHRWEPHDVLAGAGGDGLGPVFNARSCVACHFQGGVGGGGGNKQNVSSFETAPTKGDPNLHDGLIHAFAVDNRYVEDHASLRMLFPVVPGGVKFQSGCGILTRDFDPLRTQSVNSTALFGAGWIDRLSDKSILNNHLKTSLKQIGRELDGNFKGVVSGRPRVLADGRVGKFGWKAQFATLDEFVAAACANEVGLGNSRRNQAKPMGSASYPDVKPDLDDTQFDALTAFIDTLDRPEEVVVEDVALASTAARGKALFSSVGCASCHVPDMGGIEGIYSDFLLHRLDDPSRAAEGGGYGGGRASGATETVEVPLPRDHPLPEEWKTPPLWGVADSAPYMHDGASPTLQTAIARHMTNAQAVTDAYSDLSPDDRAAVIAFLKTLKAPANAQIADPEVLADSFVPPNVKHPEPAKSKPKPRPKTQARATETTPPEA